MTDEQAELREAAGWAQMMLERVSGDGGIAKQIAAGDWAEEFTDSQARDLSALLRAMGEHVRHTRAQVPVRALGNDHVPVPGTAPFDRPLPLNRKERYYTGTVFPMLVGSDGFAHLHRLLALAGLDGVDVSPGRDGSQDFQFFTEYGFAESVHTDVDKDAWPGPLEADTPDVVLAGPDWLLAIEAKMYHNPSARDLEAQMVRQAAVVSVWQQSLGLPDNRVRHILLLPQVLHDQVGQLRYPVLTWEHLLAAYEVVGPTYWANILRVALAKLPDLQSSHDLTFGSNADDVLTGAQIVEAHAAGAATFEFVGRGGGLSGDRFRADIAAGTWRTTKYEVRSGSAPNRNWFTLADFLTATGSTG